MPPPARPHLLVVDDDPALREALACALADTYVIHLAETGAQACALLRAQPIAAIILDAILGDEHGLDVVPRFRALSPAPILLFTGHGSEELASRALWEGVDGYLKKPLDLHELQRATQRLIPQLDGISEIAARARRYLDEHLAKPYRASDLAGQFGVSEVQLRRCFRATYGKTPRRYLTDVRMQHATVLLRTTALGVKQIALRVGYPSGLRFTRVFKRRCGLTPSAFRATQSASGPGGDRSQGR
jgi:AraC-like DNA-binding protein